MAIPPETPTNPTHRLADFLGLRRSILVLLAMVVLVGLGEKMAERFLPLYLFALGGGAFSVGLLNGLDNLLSALYSFPGGYLSDRLGYKRALVLFNLLAMFGYLIVILFPFWQAVILGSVFFLSWSAISLPATMGLIASALPRAKRTMGVSMHSLVRRLPMALGPLLGGFMIVGFGEETGIRLAFAVALVLGVLSLVLQQLLLPENPSRKGVILPASPRLLNPALRNLLVADILVRFCEQIPYAFVVIWCVQIHGITPVQFGLLTTVEMVTAMLIYVPVAYLADQGTKKPFVLITFGFFSAFPLLLLFSKTFWTMVLAFVVRGLKEFGEPTRKALIMDLAAEDHKASTFGLYYLLRDLVVSVAAFVGALLWDGSALQMVAEAMGVDPSHVAWAPTVLSPTTNLLTAFAFGLLGTIYFAIAGRNLKPLV
ncbi:MAG: MFS transporter [Acidobacteriota bacterium]